MNKDNKGGKPFFNAFSTIILFVVLMIIGIASLPFLSIQLEPSVTSNNVYINYDWPNASAALIEHEVTSKFEGALATIKGVNSISSGSVDGSGYVQAILNEHTNKQKIRYEIATLVRQLYKSLPAELNYPQVTTDRNDENEANKSILTYTITGKGNSFDLQQLIEKYIKPKLSLVQGVYQINLYGASGYNFELSYSPDNLNHNGLSLKDISTAIVNYHKQYELGSVLVQDPQRPQSPNFNYLTLVSNSTDSAVIDWSKVFVKRVGGRNIFLTDVVKINYAIPPPQSYYRINGLNTINIEVIANKKSNYLLLAAQIKKEISAIQKVLPKGYAILLIYDASAYLKTELNKLIWRTSATLIILLGFVLIISRQSRYLFLIILALTCNLLLAFIFYNFLKLEIHLYSLAAITISTGIIIDNAIVVIDHIRHKQNLRIILAVAGASLTIIGAVCIIFFLDAVQQVNLLDFAWIMIVNVSLSVVVSLFFIPALMEKLPLSQKKMSALIQRKRKIIAWNRFYLRAIKFSIRFRVVFTLVIILIFGLPIFMLPTTVEKVGKWENIYNATIGSNAYNSLIRPWFDKLTGGTMRLFLNKRDQFNYTNVNPKRTELIIGISMPKGTLITQMNDIVTGFENFLSKYNEVEQFQSKVISGQNATISITFKKNFENGSFPEFLKSQVQKKAIFTGLANFQINGVGESFTNDVATDAANFGITLQGYNYETLIRLAERTKAVLLKNPRVENVVIGGERDRIGAENNFEYVFRIPDEERLLVNQLSPGGMSEALNNFAGKRQSVGGIVVNGLYTPIMLVSDRNQASVWQVMNEPVRSDSATYVRLKELAALNKEKIGAQIARRNQQYQLVVNYNFIGGGSLGSDFNGQVIRQIKYDLPLGYTLKETEEDFWSNSEAKLTWAIFLTIAIVFTICVILLNNIRQSLVVITTIPISFIGVFTSALLGNYKFDEGGYASFVILSGVVVSAALYILNDFNNYKKDYPGRSKQSLYIKAYSSKIIPVLLSRISIILGMLPFMIFSKNETFWYPLAMGVTGGIVFSMIAVLFYLPMFLKELSIKN